MNLLIIKRREKDSLYQKMVKSENLTLQLHNKQVTHDLFNTLEQRFSTGVHIIPRSPLKIFC